MNPSTGKFRQAVVEKLISDPLVWGDINRFVKAEAGRIPHDSLVLDAGAGFGRHRKYFQHTRYIAMDLGTGDPTWDYSCLDVISDLGRLPFKDDIFDAAINIQVLEHMREPQSAVAELFRVLKPGGRLILTAPQGWPEHQSPHDYFRFTQFSLRMLFEDAGFAKVDIEPLGGYFKYIANRISLLPRYIPVPKSALFKFLLVPFHFFLKLVFFLFVPTLLRVFDPLDRVRDLTLNYACICQK